MSLHNKVVNNEHLKKTQERINYTNKLKQEEAKRKDNQRKREMVQAQLNKLKILKQQAQDKIKEQQRREREKKDDDKRKKLF